MSKYIKSDIFTSIASSCDNDLDQMVKEIATHHNPKVLKGDVKKRLIRYQLKGKLPLESGNKVAEGETLAGSSTLYGPDGSIKLQWIKSKTDTQKQIEQIETAVQSLAGILKPLPEVKSTVKDQNDSLLTMYISNDLHIGMLTWAPETGQDWDLTIGYEETMKAIKYLVDSAPPSKTAVVVDLGDLMDVDSMANTTPKSNNNLDVDGRYPKVLRLAYQLLINFVELALRKHERVHFLNVGGNHDMVSNHAIREILIQAFKNNPRVIVDESPSLIKYLTHGENLFQFFHGDNMRMTAAGEVMAVDCAKVFSNSRFRYSHCGHNHVQSVLDGKICKVESHRNLPPNNQWAFSMGYRRQLGTMSAITYSKSQGEIARNTYTIT